MRWLPYAKNHRVLEYKSPVHVHTHRERQASKHSCIHSYLTCRLYSHFYIVCSLSNKQFLSLSPPLLLRPCKYTILCAIWCMILFFSSGFQLPFSLYTSSLYHLNTKKIHQKFFLRCCENKIFKITRKYWVTVVVEWKVEKLDAETRLRKKEIRKTTGRKWN